VKPAAAVFISAGHTRESANNFYLLFPNGLLTPTATNHFSNVSGAVSARHLLHCYQTGNKRDWLFPLRQPCSWLSHKYWWVMGFFFLL